MATEETVYIAVNGEELLPCPFCGGTAVIFMSGNDTTGRRFSVQCAVCGMGNSGVEYVSPEEALRAWNRRRGKPGIPSVSEFFRDNLEGYTLSINFED